MALSIDRRWIQVTAADTTTITVSGLSFAPKVLLLQYVNRNTTGAATGSMRRGIGACDASGNQFAFALGSSDGRTTTTVSGHGYRSDACIVELDTDAGALSGWLAGALTSDGYTLTVADATATSFLVHAVALGGADIAAVVGSKACPGSAGQFDTTVTGITPNVLLLAGVGNRGHGGLARRRVDPAKAKVGGEKMGSDPTER